MLIAAVAAIVVCAAFVLFERNRKQRLLAIFRSAWGTVRPRARLSNDKIADAWRDAIAYDEAPDSLDKRTWSDLNLDDCVATLDRTSTPIGSQTLYRRVRACIPWTETSSCERMVRIFLADQSARERVALRLLDSEKTLGQDIWHLTRPNAITTRWWFWFFPFLSAAMIISLVMFPLFPQALAAAVLILLVNMGARVAAEWQVPQALTSMRQVGPVLRVATALSRLQVLSEVDSAVAAARDIESLASLRRATAWLTRDPAVIGEGLASVYEYLNIVFLLDANALLFAERHLRERGGADALRRVCNFVGDVDVALSLASLRSEARSWCSPANPESNQLELRDVWHPLTTDPVPNDATLAPGSGMIITGANMTGKSTYLRAVGIALVLGRTLNVVPASSCSGTLPRVRCLFGVSDDVMAGQSYYIAEAVAIVELLKYAREQRTTLFLLDELLRGTNTVERLSGAEAVLRELVTAQHNAHRAIAATHDGELVNLLADRYEPFHFRELIVQGGIDGGLVFDYKRRPGAATTRTALALLEFSGAPRELIDAARLRSHQLETSHRT